MDQSLESDKLFRVSVSDSKASGGEDLRRHKHSAVELAMCKFINAPELFNIPEVLLISQRERWDTEISSAL